MSIKLDRIIHDNMEKYLSKTPTIALIEITKSCNKMCPFCYSDFASDSTSYIYPEKISQFIAFLSQQGIEQVILSGGEPLTYQHLATFLVALNSINAKVTVITNGLLLSQEMLMLLIDNGCNIKYSFDIENHYAYSPLNMLAKMQYLHKTIVTFVYYTQDIDLFIATIEKIIKDYNVTVEVNNAFSLGNAEIDKAILEKMLIVSKRLIDLNLEKEYSIIGKTISELVESFFHLSSLKTFNCSICNQIKIDVDGNIFPCSYFSKDENQIGNIFYFDENRYFARICEFKKTLYRRIYSGKCDKCKWKYLCGGGCLVSLESKYVSETNLHSCYLNREIFEYLNSIFHVYI